ncbi:TPA: hypothetical protein ACJW21_000834 [Streptococcus pneumoniae]
MTQSEFYNRMTKIKDRHPKWESQGLRRYQPPDDGSRMIYYLVTDIWKFLGVDE